MLFPNPRTHLVIDKSLVEGTNAFKAALKKEVEVYFAEIGKYCTDEEFDIAFANVINYRFDIGGFHFTYYRG